MNTFSKWWYFLHYNPKDRIYQEGREWLHAMREELSEGDMGDVAPLFGLTETELSLFPFQELRYILETITYPPPNPHLTRKEIEELYFQGDFKGTDSIHHSSLQALICKGLARMEESWDPAHELSHIIRASRFAKVLYANLKNEHADLDWGTIAGAIVWHDISRTRNVGALYNKHTFLRRLLRNISLLQTLFIYFVWKHDAQNSCLEFLKESRSVLPATLRHRIAFAILADRVIPALQKYWRPNDALYQDIVLAADCLDQATIARGETMYELVAQPKKGDLLYINRLLILNLLFKIEQIPRYLRFDAAGRLYDIVKATSYCYLSKFYPTDARILAHAFARSY
jgi:hypothetical protein